MMPRRSLGSYASSSSTTTKPGSFSSVVRRASDRQGTAACYARINKLKGTGAPTRSVDLSFISSPSFGKGCRTDSGRRRVAS